MSTLQTPAVETFHGFALEPGQDASSLRWWTEFVEYFERVEGITPHPRDSQHKRLFEYFMQGAFCQWQEFTKPPAQTGMPTGFTYLPRRPRRRPA